MPDYGAINNVYRGAFDADAGHGVSPNWLYGYFNQIGANPNEAHMLTSAAASESRLNPGANHDGGVGYGFWGHNGTRLLAMKDFARRAGGSIADPRIQARFALDELRSRPEGKAVANATTPEQLALAQMHYEAPQGFTSANPEGGHNYTGRLNQIRLYTGLNPNATGAFAPSANPQVTPDSVRGAAVPQAGMGSYGAGDGSNAGDPNVNAALQRLMERMAQQNNGGHRTPLISQLLGKITSPIREAILSGADSLSSGIADLFGGAGHASSPASPASAAGQFPPSLASGSPVGSPVAPVSGASSPPMPAFPQDVPMPPPRPPEFGGVQFAGVQPSLAPIGEGGVPSMMSPNAMSLMSLFGGAG